MLGHNRPRRRSWLRFCFLFSVVITGCTSADSQPVRVQTFGGERRPPALGVRVTEVHPGGQAERASIQVMDLLSKYGKFTVIDHSTYYKARAEYLKNPDVKVQVEFWRGPTLITIQVFPGTIGMATNEYNPVAYQFDSAMMHIDVLQEIPGYMRDVEFKDAFEKEGGIAEGLVKAKAIIDRAEAEGTLTPTQIQVGRIRTILDDAPAEELKQLDVLLADFIRNQPPEYIGNLGLRLEEKGHFRPARQLLKHYLLTDPENVSVRLSLGYVNLRLGFWEEAEAAADLALSNPDLSPYRFCIAYQQKAVAALSRGDYNTSITFAEKAFAYSRGAFEMLLIQLAAAATGDVEKFNETAARFKEALPDKYEAYKLQVDSAEALALAMSGQEERARSIIAGWSNKDRVEGRLRNYWREFPAGNKVVENWLRLAPKN
jgi:hypothetical protein